MSAMNDGWDAASRLFQIPDTPQTRLAFSQGARHTLGRLIDTPPDQRNVKMLAMNEEIHTFASACLTDRTAPANDVGNG